MAGRAQRPSGPSSGFTLPALRPFVGDRLDAHGEYDALAFDGRDFSEQDAPDSRFLECRFDRCRLDGAVLRRVRIIGSLLVDVHATSVDLADSTWRDTQVSGGRLGAVMLAGSAWSGVEVRDCKLDFVNVAGATVDDVTFQGCEIGTLDARASQLRHVTFADCRIDELNVVGATLTKVDVSDATLRSLIGIESLRGAIVSAAQLLDLAPLLAAELGISVRN